VHIASGEPFSLAKVGRLVAIPRTTGYSESKEKDSKRYAVDDDWKFE